MGTALENTMNWEEICEHVLLKVGRKLKRTEVPTFRKWFMEREKVGYLIDYILILRCFRIWQELKIKLDHFIVISGREGLGKSTLSFQIASWVNPNFTIDNICYGTSAYVDILRQKAKEFKKNNNANEIPTESLVMDEGTELLSREALNVTNRILTKTFFVQRALKFLVIINIPNFFMLDSVVRNHRVRTLIELTQRGNYKAITGSGIPRVVKEGMISKNVLGVKLMKGCWWQGSFRKEFPKNIDREKYEEFKMEGIRNLLEEMKDDVVSKKLIAVGKIAKEIGCSNETLISMIKREELKGKQVSSKWYVTRASYDKLMTV